MKIPAIRYDWRDAQSLAGIGVTLRRQPGDYTIAQLPVLSPIPAWCDGQGFVSVSRGDNELSVICLKNRVPARIVTEGEWACFKLDGSSSPKVSGALSVVRQLHDGGIGAFIVSTFSGSYLFMRSDDRVSAIDCLAAAGYDIT